MHAARRSRAGVADPLSGRASDDPRERARTLIELSGKDDGTPAAERIEHFFAHLRDREPLVRRAALDALGRFAVESEVLVEAASIGRVTELARDPDPEVRAEAAVAIAIVAPAGLEEVRPVLRSLLEDPVATVRREAAAALGDVRDPDAAGALARHLEDPDREVRFESAFALASLRDRRGLEVLVGGLDESRRRLDACEGLRRLGSRDAAPALRRVAERLFLAWPERLTALATLYAVGEHDPAAARILERTRARNREERAYALALLGTHAIREGGPALVEVARAARDPLAETAVRALGELGDPAHAAVLASIAGDAGASSELRTDAVDALARLAAIDPGEESARALGALAGSADREVADAAARHLERSTR